MALLEEPFYQVTMAAQVGFYALAVLGSLGFENAYALAMPRARAPHPLSIR